MAEAYNKYFSNELINDYINKVFYISICSKLRHFYQNYSALAKSEMLRKATVKGFPSHPGVNAVFEALRVSVRECCDLPNPAQRWPVLFSCFSSLVSWARASWVSMVRALHLNGTLPALGSGSSTLLPPSAASDKCSYSKYITICSLPKRFAGSPHSKQSHWHRALLGWKELGQTEDISPSEDSRW